MINEEGVLLSEELIRVEGKEKDQHNADSVSASSEDSPSLKADTRAERRQKFFEERRREILTWGVEVIDEALVVYRATDSSHEGNSEAESAPTQSDTEQRFTVRDRMVLDAQNCDGVQFLKLLEEQWWPARQKLRELGQVRIAEHGLYSRYLDESGFLLVADPGQVLDEERLRFRRALPVPVRVLERSPLA